MAYLTQKEFKRLGKSFVDRAWLDNFERLNQFHDKFHRFPQDREKWHGHNLGIWCRGQRMVYRKGIIKLWRVKLLNEVDFQLEIPDAFEKNAGLLDRLWRERPESWPCVPRRFYPKECGMLLAWIHSTRKHYANGELSRHQIKLLKSIKFPFDTRNKIVWNRKLERFRLWVEKHGRYPSKTKNNEEERKLAAWRDYIMLASRRGWLPKDREKTFQSLRPDLLRKGMLLKKNSWDIKYDHLRDMYRENPKLRGDIPVPRNHPDFQMWHNWFHQHKSKARHGKLPKDKIQLLKKIGIDIKNWRMTSRLLLPKAWDLKMEQLQTLSKKYPRLRGNVPVPRNHPEFQSWYEWFQRTKSKSQQGALSNQNIQALKEFGIDISNWRLSTRLKLNYNDEWMRNYSSLKRIVETTGQLPQDKKGNTDHQRLVKWFNNQRKMLKKGDFGKEKAELISEFLPKHSLSNQVSPDDLLEWKRKYFKVKRFAKAIGHLPYMTKGNSDQLQLARWLARQKNKLAHGNLDREQGQSIARLLSIYG